MVIHFKIKQSRQALGMSLYSTLLYSTWVLIDTSLAAKYINLHFALDVALNFISSKSSNLTN